MNCYLETGDDSAYRYLDWMDLIRILKLKDFVPDGVVSQKSKYGD